MTPQPYIMLGFCCGCRENGNRTLYRVSQDRFRCIECYYKETGHLP